MLLLAAVVAAGVVVARRSRVTPQIERDVHAAPAKVPAPDSPLARALGADDAGRGEYNLYEDGPSCGLAPRVDKTKRLGAGTVVHAANIQDRDGAKRVLEKLKVVFPRLELIWADCGYRGTLIVWVQAFGDWV